MEMKVGHVCLHEFEKTGKMIANLWGKRTTQKCLLLIKYTLFLNPKQEKRFWSADQKRFCLQSELTCMLPHR